MQHTKGVEKTVNTAFSRLFIKISKYIIEVEYQSHEMKQQEGIPIGRCRRLKHFQVITTPLIPEYKKWGLAANMSKTRYMCFWGNLN